MIEVKLFGGHWMFPFDVIVILLSLDEGEGGPEWLDEWLDRAVIPTDPLVGVLDDFGWIERETDRDDEPEEDAEEEDEDEVTWWWDEGWTLDCCWCCWWWWWWFWCWFVPEDEDITPSDPIEDITVTLGCCCCCKAIEPIFNGDDDIEDDERLTGLIDFTSNCSLPGKTDLLPLEDELLLLQRLLGLTNGNPELELLFRLLIFADGGGGANGNTDGGAKPWKVVAATAATAAAAAATAAAEDEVEDAVEPEEDEEDEDPVEEVGLGGCNPPVGRSPEEGKVGTKAAWNIANE